MPISSPAKFVPTPPPLNLYTWVSDRDNPECPEMSWAVRLVNRGDRYLQRHILIHDQDVPLVEFFDPRFVSTFGGYGQFVSRYTLDTLTERERTGPARGLLLDSSAPEWTLSAPALTEATEWAVHAHALRQGMRDCVPAPDTLLPPRPAARQEAQRAVIVNDLLDTLRDDDAFLRRNGHARDALTSLLRQSLSLQGLDPWITSVKQPGVRTLLRFAMEQEVRGAEVIFSQQEFDADALGDGGFWNHKSGWGDLMSADILLPVGKLLLPPSTLPSIGTPDARTVRYADVAWRLATTDESPIDTHSAQGSLSPRAS